MRLEINIADRELARFQNMIGAVGSKKARAAMARAVNRTTRSIHGKVIRAVAKQSSIPLKIVRKSVRMSLAAHQGEGAIQGVVYATGSPLSLKHFNARQFAFGVRAKVFGETRRYPSAFIYAGNFRSGNPVANGHVFQRVGKARLPIEKLTGPSVPEELVRGESAHAFSTTASSMLPARIAHELGRLLQA